MVTREVHGARGHEETPVDQVYDAVGEVGREVRAVIVRPVLFEPARHIHARVALAERQLDVGVALVVTQQNVVARLELLDQVVLERERLLLVVEDDGLKVVGRLEHQVPLLVRGAEAPAPL